MGIRTAILASLMALVIPSFSGAAIATSNPDPTIQELTVDELLVPESSSNYRFMDSESTRDLFSQPFYQTEQRPQRREKILAEGTEGSQVMGLQQRLKVHGFYLSQVDSVFGPRTKAAVREFQSAKGLEVTGTVDRETWMALSADPQPVAIEADESITKGAKGTDVRMLQERLATKGYNPGPVDGVFGPRTLAAVKAFQEANSLDVNGTVTEETWIVLNQS